MQFDILDDNSFWIMDFELFFFYTVLCILQPYYNESCSLSKGYRRIFPSLSRLYTGKFTWTDDSLGQGYELRRQWQHFLLWVRKEKMLYRMVCKRRQHNQLLHGIHYHPPELFQHPFQHCLFTHSRKQCQAAGREQELCKFKECNLQGKRRCVWENQCPIQSSLS